MAGDFHVADAKVLVIVCHGLGWDKENELIIAICNSFQEKNINAFRFNFSGYKPSGGEPEDSYYTKQSNDLCSVIDHFVVREGYQIRAVVGHSTGASAAIIQASRDRRVESLILIAPRIIPSNSIIVKAINKSGKTLSGIVESPETIYPYALEIKDKKGEKSRIYHFSKEYLKELEDINIIACLKQVKVPIVILRGTQDKVVSKEEVDEACKANKLAMYIPIDGAGHTFKDPEHRDKLITEIMQWKAI